jgi:hypothetical protein
VICIFLLTVSCHLWGHGQSKQIQCLNNFEWAYLYLILMCQNNNRATTIHYMSTICSLIAWDLAVAFWNNWKRIERDLHSNYNLLLLTFKSFGMVWACWNRNLKKVDIHFFRSRSSKFFHIFGHKYCPISTI